MGDLETIDFGDLLKFDFELQAFGDEDFFEDITTDTTVQKSAPAATEPLPSTSHENQENVNKGPTFVEVSDEHKVRFINDMKNKNTVRKTETVMRQFTRFLTQEPRAEFREIHEIPATELDNYIGSFLLSLRKSDGTEYEPDTLTSYHRSIDRFLREKNYPYSMIIDKQFATSRTILASKRKELKQKGKGNYPNKAEPISENEEKILKENGVIGLHSPRALTNKMWLQNTLMFGIRGGTENRSIHWGDITLKIDELGTEYLEYNERNTKTRTGETNTHQRAFRPKIFATPDDLENCPVNAYKLFQMRRPPSMNTPDSPFYLAINHRRKPDTDIWYKNQPLGENSIRSIMKEMASAANLPGRKTNHSARKTTCTKLLHAGVEATTIQQLTGHKNVQSVMKYATASHEMQKSMSDILCSKQDKFVANKPCTPQPQTEPVNNLTLAVHPVVNPTVTPAGPVPGNSAMNLASRTHSSTSSSDFLREAKLANCTINVHYHSGPTVPKFRRVRVIESSSDSD